MPHLTQLAVLDKHAAAGYLDRMARSSKRRKAPPPREKTAMEPRPWDGHTPAVLYKTDTRDVADKALHRRIGPAVPPSREDDWY